MFFRKNFVLGLFVFVVSSQAQSIPFVRITEISPLKVGAEEEWFEFSLQSPPPLDISDWKISNGTSTKTFLEKKELLAGAGFVEENGRIIFSSDTSQYLYWTKSPVSLPNDGGTIRILNAQNEVLDEVTYPDTKSGTRDSEPYAEIWNRTPELLDDETHPLFPLVFRKNDAALRHSKGEENFDPPTFPENVEVLISEISPSRGAPNPETDFVEIFVKSATSAQVNLKYMQIKQKNSPRILMEFQNDFWVHAGEFIVVYFTGNEVSAVTRGQNPYEVSSVAEGLSSGSETLEVILYSGTSWGKSEDFICWKSGDLSESVKTEVDKKISENVWSGDCLEVEDLLANESRAREEPQHDSNTHDDFFRHYNGSPGENNSTQNHAPIARFLVQGGARVSTLSMNFTGFDGTANTSTDPDGADDLVGWKWEINGKTCGNFDADGWEWRQTRIGGRSCEEESALSNPDRMYFDFDRFSSFSLKLTVTDASGTSSTMTETIQKDFLNAGAGSAPSAFRDATEAWVTKQLLKTEKQKSVPQNARKKEEVSDDFFTDFLSASLALSNLPEPAYDSLDFSTFAPISLEVEPDKRIIAPPLFKRERVPDAMKPRIRKNIGLVLLLDL